MQGPYYKITHYLPAGDTCVHSQVYNSYQFLDWKNGIQFVELGTNKKFWLSGCLKIERIE